MKLRKIVQAISVIAFGVSSVAAVADTAPVYNVSVVNSVNTELSVGPFAKSLGEGDNPTVVSILYKNNIFDYYNMAPEQFDLGQRYLRYYDCNNIYNHDVCSRFWDVGAYGWRKDMLDDVRQFAHVQDSGVPSYEDEYVINKVGENGESVGYRVDKTYTSKYKNHNTYGVAKFNGKTFTLTSPVTYEKAGTMNKALTYFKLPDGKVLVGGYGTFGSLGNESWFYDCYWGDADENGDLNICPAFKTQATIWIIDPVNDEDGKVITGFQPKDYLRFKADPDYVVSAAVNDFVTIDNKVYAVGYSATDDNSYSTIRVSSIASYWPLTIDLNAKTLTYDSQKELQNLEHPGSGDHWNEYTWATGVNKNGYVIANRKMAKSENLNRANNFVLTKINADGSSVPVTYPLQNYAFKGYNSVAEDINDQNFVVGFGDFREDNYPVNNGARRNQEGFLYDINKSKNYYINDLICHKKDDGNKDCSINGKYYYIEWVTSINENNVILASGYEYSNVDDWVNYTNAKIVTLKLTPSSEGFTVNTEGQKAVNDSLVVTYSRSKPVVENKSSGGGSMGIFSLVLLGFGSFCLRKTKKK